MGWVTLTMTPFTHPKRTGSGTEVLPGSSSASSSPASGPASGRPLLCCSSDTGVRRRPGSGCGTRGRQVRVHAAVPGGRALVEHTAGNSWVLRLLPGPSWGCAVSTAPVMAPRGRRHSDTPQTHPGTSSMAWGCRRCYGYSQAPCYLEDGVQVSQRGPALPGVAHPLAVGIVLVGRHHVHRVVAEGPGAEGAAGQVGGLGTVTARALGGCVGPPAPLLHAQEGADGEAATAAGRGQIWDGQLGHCPCPGACQVGDRVERGLPALYPAKPE